MKITYLEMTAREQLRPSQQSLEPLRVEEVIAKDWHLNYDLYRLVGEPWSWRDRLAWSVEQWRSFAEAPSLRTYVAYAADNPAGYFELSDQAGDVEIVSFGLAPAYLGQRLGGPFLTHAIETAWGLNAKRVWLHTCSADHPHAISNYQARGFTIYREELVHAKDNAALEVSS